MQRHTVSIGLVLALAALAMGRPAPAQTDAAGTAGGVGILPVYDRSGEAYGRLFARHLTAALFEVLSRSGTRFVLLNPGRAVTSLDDDLVLEYARSAGVDAVVASMLDATKRDSRTDSKPEIVVSAIIVNLATDRESHEVSVRKEVKRADLERGFDASSGAMMLPAAAGGGGPSRRLSKQPLGKVVVEMATTLAGSLQQQLPGLVELRPAPGPAGRTPCDVAFRVRYLSNRASSKMYDVIVNGLEESISVRDGVLPINAVPGMLFIELAVRDAPYRVPVQPVYLMNTWVDCASDARNLTFEIGESGEGLLAWR